MDLIVWLASFGKVRKDELLGFFELANPKNEDVLVRDLQELMASDIVRVGSYQKLSLTNPDQPFSMSRVVRQVAKFGIPPYQLIAFLRNQGVENTYEFMYTISEMLTNDELRTNGAGMLIVIEPNGFCGGYVDGPDFRRMYQRLHTQVAQGAD